MTGEELYLIYTHMSIKANKSFDRDSGLAKKYISLIIRNLYLEIVPKHENSTFCLHNLHSYMLMFFRALFSIYLFKQISRIPTGICILGPPTPQKIG